MDRKSSAGMLKTVHLAVDLHHNESPPCGRSAVEWLLERARHTPLLNIREEFEKCKPRRTTVFNRALAFSGTREKSGVREKKWAHRGCQTFSPHAGAENGPVSKWFALWGYCARKC